MKGLSIAVGDEGGFAPAINTIEAIDSIMMAIEKAGYIPGEDVMLALDAATTEFCLIINILKGEVCHYPMKTRWNIGGISLMPIDRSIEDPFAEEDWTGYVHMTSELGDHVQIVGDDLFVTNQERLVKGIELEAANAILIK